MNKYYIKISIENSSIDDYLIDSRREIKELLETIGNDNISLYILSKKQNRQINTLKTFQEERIYSGDILCLNGE